MCTVRLPRFQTTVAPPGSLVDGGSPGKEKDMVSEEVLKLTARNNNRDAAKFLVQTKYFILTSLNTEVLLLFFNSKGFYSLIL